jgi:hypothetical protein
VNKEYVVIPKDEVKHIMFPFINNSEADFLTGETKPIAIIENYPVFAYKYAIREDMFDDNVVTLDILFYLGTRYYPRKTSNKFSSVTLSIQFTIKVPNKDELENRMWDYIYSIERMNAEQLISLNYKTYYNDDLQSEEEKDVIKIFKTIGYIG